jgi:DNA mismatch repair protein MSH5
MMAMMDGGSTTNNTTTPSSLYNDNAVRYDPSLDQQYGHGGDDGLPFVSPGATPNFGSSGYGMTTTATTMTFPMPTTTLRAMTVVEDGHNRLGFCCYDQSRNEIVLEECVFTSSSSSSSSSETVDVLLEEILMVVRPTLLLLSHRIVQNEVLFEVLTRPLSAPPLSAMQQQDLDDDDGGTSATNDNGKCGQQQQQEKSQDGSHPTFTPSTIPYQILKSKCFDLPACRNLILQKLHVLSLHRRPSYHVTGGTNNNTIHPTSNFHSLASVIDFDSKVIVQALGSLLSFLVENLFQMSFQYSSNDGTGGSFGGGGGVITVNRVVPARISSFMSISSSTLSALQVFSTEQHPLLFAEGHGNSKEGFSLFSYLDRTKSRGGRQKLREWMLKPLADLDDIVVRHDLVEFFLHSSVDKPIGSLMRHLKTIRSIDRILLRMNKIATTPRDFLDLSSTLLGIICIARILYEEIIPQAKQNTSKSCYEYLCDMYSRCNVELMIDLKNRISDMVDEEAMSQNGNKNVVIRDGYNERLDNLREQAEEMDDRLYHTRRLVEVRLRHITSSQTTRAMMTLSSSIGSITVTFAQQLGFLVGFIDEDKGLREILPEDFEYICTHNGEDFYVCDEMRDLADQFGDFISDIKDTEQKIIGDMEGIILDTESELQDCFDALSELDCFLSFAECAIDSNFTKPRMVDDSGGRSRRNHRSTHLTPNEDNQDIHTRAHQSTRPSHIIDIKDGRHPLQELTSERIFVPNDVHITNSECVNVVTGPNFSGKSCYLRQVGLLVYMAHIGSFLPCSSATISVTDHIGARIPTPESCSRPQSSFQRELTEISSILRRATNKSLVIIDEFGKGTNPVSGISILGATLKHLAKAQCRTVCATHLLELFSMNVLSDGQDGIRARRMTMELPDSSKAGGGTALPLFKLEDGISPSSAAAVCARRAGVDPGVIDRTRQIVETRRAHNSIHRLWTMDQGYPLTEKQLQFLATFASTDFWGPDKREEVTTLLKLAAQFLYRQE